MSEAVKKALANSKAYIMTAYARFSEVSKAEYIEATAEELNIDISMLPAFNEYLEANNTEAISPMEEIDEYLSGLDPVEAFRQGVIGQFNYTDDYFSHDEYNNIESYSEYQVLEMMKESHDFKLWYVENIQEHDETEIKQAISDCNILLAAGY